MHIPESGLVFKKFLEVLSDNLEHEGKQVYYEDDKVIRIGFYDEKVVIYTENNRSGAFNEINLSNMYKPLAENLMESFSSKENS